MKTPVEILRQAIMDGKLKLRMKSAPEQSIAALEAAGFVIAHPDQVTEGMVHAGIIAFASTKSDGKELTAAIAAALRAAPKWSKGSEG